MRSGHAPNIDLWKYFERGDVVWNNWRSTPSSSYQPPGGYILIPHFAHLMFLMHSVTKINNFALILWNWCHLNLIIVLRTLECWWVISRKNWQKFQINRNFQTFVTISPLCVMPAWVYVKVKPSNDLIFLFVFNDVHLEQKNF